jgi:SRSO17 transposase
VCASCWPPEPLERVLAEKAQALVGGQDAVLIVDDTALLKQGRRSVASARQYAGRRGKTANCQTLVSLTLARGEVPVGLALRLFLPAEWTDDPARCRAAGVPADRIAYRTKLEIALDEIDRVTAAGVTYGCVLADAGYGHQRQLPAGALRARPHVGRRHPAHPEGLPGRRDHRDAGADAGVGRPRRHPRPSVPSAPAEDVLARRRLARLT